MWMEALSQDITLLPCSNGLYFCQSWEKRVKTEVVTDGVGVRLPRKRRSDRNHKYKSGDSALLTAR